MAQIAEDIRVVGDVGRCQCHHVVGSIGDNKGAQQQWGTLRSVVSWLLV